MNFEMTRIPRAFLAGLAGGLWLYAAFLADRLFSIVGMAPALNNSGWIALPMQSPMAGSIFALSALAFIAAMTVRRRSGFPEFMLWVVVMIGVCVQFREIAPRFLMIG